MRETRRHVGAHFPQRPLAFGGTIRPAAQKPIPPRLELRRVGRRYADHVSDDAERERHSETFVDLDWAAGREKPVEEPRRGCSIAGRYRPIRAGANALPTSRFASKLIGVRMPSTPSEIRSTEIGGCSACATCDERELDRSTTVERMVASVPTHTPCTGAATFGASYQAERRATGEGVAEPRSGDAAGTETFHRPGRCVGRRGRDRAVAATLGELCARGVRLQARAALAGLAPEPLAPPGVAGTATRPTPRSWPSTASAAWHGP